MTTSPLLLTFLALRLLQQLGERFLARANRTYYLDTGRQKQACGLLGLNDDEFTKTLAYAEDRYAFGSVASWLQFLLTLGFIAFGGLGLVESWAKAGASALPAGWGGEISVGLGFFALLGLASMLVNLPFAWYSTFVIEARHGFNRQTPRGFVSDRLKGLLLAILIGGPILTLLLWIMQATGTWWWLYAWAAVSGFGLLTAWLYPTFLAPLFNKFTPLPDAELKHLVDRLAAKIGFRTAGVFVMDASKRSTHGNAYFTGVFGKKRIVLFDTLVTAMAPEQVVAVLAHELGHFKLHHVRWGLLRGTLTTGLTLYLLSLCLPLASFYHAFALADVSIYGALVVFGLWFGLTDFLLAPLENYLSRRHEFAADRFARENLGAAGADDLRHALVKLREQSHAMPITHPWYSAVYHSHPPLLERLLALQT